VWLGRWAIRFALPFRGAVYLTVTTSADGCLPAGAAARRGSGEPAGSYFE
jgi:hypothetical protein